MTTDRHEQARAEARDILSDMAAEQVYLPSTPFEAFKDGFVMGAGWAGANRTITREECLHVGGLVQSGWPLERILKQIGIEVTDDD